jgi:signal transduction histidine kinase
VGDPVPLPEGVELSAYRIVQEGLTNALKHARARRADVTLHFLGEQMEIDVLDDGDGGSRGDGLGSGLIGVRERVGVYGGHMTAGAAPGGGFLLAARIPLRARRP